MATLKFQNFLKPDSGNSSPMRQRICRVLNGPNCFVCGLCGRRFEKVSDAWKCLTGNVLKLESHPVVSGNNQVQSYQCLLCGKIHTHQEDTSLCTLRDLEDARLPKVISEHLYAMVYAQMGGQGGKSKRSSIHSRHHPSKTGSSKPRSSNKPIQPHVDDDDDSQRNDTPTTGGDSSEEMKVQEPQLENISEAADQISINQGEKVYKADHEKEKPVRFRTPGQKPFVRINSNYVCSVCNEKFFTKTEVETHFEAHPLMDTV